MGSKPKSTSSSVSGSAQAWAQPYARAAAGDIQGVFNRNQAGINKLTHTVQNNLVPELVEKFRGGIGATNRARGFYNDVLSGDYLNGNPHLDAMIGAARGGITDHVNSQFSLAGRYGSNAHGAGLAKELGNMETGLRYQNYGDEMNRMAMAAQGASDMNNADVAQALAAAGIGAEIPYAGSNALANGLGALFNGGTQNSTQKGASPIWGAVGAGLGAAGMALSDRRVKTNIQKVGEFDDGLGIYEFDYVKDMGLPSNRFRGVMADEVAVLRPHALGTPVNGYATVNYGAL